MRVARISGEVTVEFIVRSDGLVERPVAIRSTHQEFEEPALREVRRWRFEPGEREGRAVNSRVRIVIPFQAR